MEIQQYPEVMTEATCPAGDMRKTATETVTPARMIQIDDAGVWHIYGFDEARQILRSDVTRQAGFAAETVLQSAGQLLNQLPILYLEGEEHHRLRRETNKFFTPRVTDRDYRDFMNDFADDLMARIKEEKRVDLSEISMDMAVQVAGQIVGLTNSIFPGMKGRLEALIAQGQKAMDGKTGWVAQVTGQTSTVSFLALDVWPAVRARRKQRREDVISYLLDRGYSVSEILTECIVYGVAGMVTTREFISVALWHLLENPHLMERMRVGSEKERYAILHEILRLEPVVSHLYRRLEADLTIDSDGEQITIPAGAKVDLHIELANIDPRAMGDNSAAVCPMRDRAELRPKVPEYGLSFGDGAHRCPGAYVAIQETDIFLRKLLNLPGLRIEREPDVNHFEIAESYEIRNFIVVVD